MKNKFFIFLLYVYCLSCMDKKKQEDNTLLGDEVVTFIIKDFPDTHNFDNDIYLSGDFEGWSGGSTPFKLKKENKVYSIDVPKHRETISYKFTKGDWGSVECKENGNPIENRIYSFKKLKDTIEISIINWTNKRQQNKPSTAAENVQVFAENFEIPQLNRKRRISIYLPPHYNTSKKNYPVLYIQDGQNVFDVSTSYSGEWEVDETLNAMFNETGFGLIVVAIDHGGNTRLNEYSAWDNEKYGKGEAELYLDFLINTLKPEIDKSFRTKPDSQNTAVMGSSLGGLFAHYAAIKRPAVFGKVGVFSPSFWYAKDSFEFTEKAIGIDNSKIYYLVGAKEGNEMLTPMNNMVNLMKANGFQENYIHNKVVDNGTHSESFWKSEFKEAIKWLFVSSNKEGKKAVSDSIQKGKRTYFKAYPKAQLSSGILMRLDSFPSKHVKPRPVDVWLPENYSEDKKYAILYMHDGQMLFDSTSTWNKQEWKVDEWASKLINTKKIKEFIVVAIHNIPEIRWQNLFPQKAIDYLDKNIEIRLLEGKSVNVANLYLDGDNYLKFLIKEIKPIIDLEFSVFTDVKNTFVAGSSMGGLMSMYAICEYPDVFSGAACLSTHWPGAAPINNNAIPNAIFKYMVANLPDSETHKIYFDYGTETLDSHYSQYASRVDEILEDKGYTASNFKNLKFEGTDHSENAWNKRLDIPLTFLLEKK